MNTTQQHLPIETIQDDLVYLKDGGVSLVLSTSAVNFGLLFETEQVAIIDAFAGLLNSLSFPIQIVIISKRLDVSSYLKTLDKAMQSQNNPLLSRITSSYRSFVENLIKEKDVLDKQFYICLSVSSLEIGMLRHNLAERKKKAITVLAPRREHLVKQLAMIGLKSKQLPSVELIKLFYDIYNPISNTPQTQVQPQVAPTVITQTQVQPTLQKPQPIAPPTPIAPLPAPSLPQNQTRFPTQPPAPSLPLRQPLTRIAPSQPTPSTPQRPNYPSYPLTQTAYNLRPPFVVEELADDFGP